LKILFVIPSITNYFTFLEDLVNALIDSGEEVHLATSTQHISDIDCYQRDLRCTLHDINFPRGFALINHFEAAKQLNQLVTNIKPDIVNVHFSAAIYTAALAKRKHWPVTLGTFHGLSYPIITGWQKLVIGLAEKWSARQMDVVYVLTEDDRENLELSTKKGKVRTFRSFGLGCNLSTFDKSAIPVENALALKKSLGINEDDFVFIFIGRQVHFKGFDKIIKSFMSLYKTHPNFKLILVGAKDHIHSNNLSVDEMKAMQACKGIISLGWRENVNEYLNISDVNVFPSIREGLPVNLMESLAMGVPVITIGSRGCRDVVIHQIDGLVLEENSVEALSQAMLQMYNDPELLKRLSNNCLRARDRFDRKNFIDEQFEIAKELASQQVTGGDKVHS
jgi:glycosyltransferase involved in cell wall biosynthesis